VANGPDEVWSWDITYLWGPLQGQFLHLCMLVDIWSRMIARARQTAAKGLDGKELGVLAGVSGIPWGHRAFHRCGHLQWARCGSSAASALRSYGGGPGEPDRPPENVSFGVEFQMPDLFWLLYALFPFSLINSNRSLPIYFGNGQVMMFTQDVYRAIGGHRAIRDNVFDDISLHSHALYRLPALPFPILHGARASVHHLPVPCHAPGLARSDQPREDRVEGKGTGTFRMRDAARSIFRTAGPALESEWAADLAPYDIRVDTVVLCLV